MIIVFKGPIYVNLRSYTLRINKSVKIKSSGVFRTSHINFYLILVLDGFLSIIRIYGLYFPI